MSHKNEGTEHQTAKAAEQKKAKNLLMIRERMLASLHTGNWKKHAWHSEVYAGMGK